MKEGEHISKNSKQNDLHKPTAIIFLLEAYRSYDCCFQTREIKKERYDRRD